MIQPPPQSPTPHTTSQSSSTKTSFPFHTSPTSLLRLFVLGLIISVVISKYLQLCQLIQMKEPMNDPLLKFPDTLANSSIENSEAGNLYIHRLELENIMKNVFTLTPNGGYFIVYGYSGVGKTELVTHAAIGIKGVVKIQVSSFHTHKDLVQSTLEHLKYQGDFDLETLVNEMRNVKEKNDIYPTIIFDVERRGGTLDDRAILEVVKSFAKELAVACRCIIVLSETNALLEFGGMFSRENFIFVDELKDHEAIQFLRVRGCQISEQDLRDIFEKIGTHPVFLQDIVNLDKISVDKYVEKRLRDATQDLFGFSLQTILQGLKDHPDGVPPSYFKTFKENGVVLSRPSAVGEIMKKEKTNNPILFHREHGQYRLISTAHKTAIKNYDPLNPLALL